MRVRTVLRSFRAPATVAVAFALSACAGNSTQLAPPQTLDAQALARQAAASASVEPDKGGQLLYVADEGSPNVVNIFSQKNLNAGPIGTITDGVSTPDGMAFDASRNLYVTNAGNNTITVYPKGATSPSTTYTQGLATPANIALGTDGTLYVVNLNGGSEFVNEFPPGSMTPTLKIPAPASYYENGVAVDSSNNLYVAYHNSSGGGAVYRYPQGSTTGTNLNLPVHTPSGLVVDKNDNLIVADATIPAAVLVFEPGSNVPLRKTTTGLGNPFLACLNQKQNRYYVSDSYPSPEGVDVFTYPKLKYLERVSAGIQVPAGCAAAAPTTP